MALTLRSSYDVVIGGGSVAGLSFASEASKGGLRVLVLEEDERIGEPEKCDGLVSMRSLGRYLPPSEACVQSRVKRGVVYGPSGGSAVVDASNLGVVVIDRSAYDQQIADLATANGAEILTSSRVTGILEEGKGGVSVKVGSDGWCRCTYYVDSTGPASLLQSNQKGLIPAAKYEVRGDWFTDGEVEVHLDRSKYPGFFAWVIPRGDGIAKVGVAGHGINSFRTLDSFLSGKRYEVLTRVAAPIYVGGPISTFASGHVVRVGESAGQVKPTTAGGILGSVAAGLIAGRWMAKRLRDDDDNAPASLEEYQREWDERFSGEFRTMKLMRRVFTDLSNDDMDQVVALLSSKRMSGRLASSDFDFHATALISALGAKDTLRLASLLLSAEAREALSSLVQ